MYSSEYYIHKTRVICNPYGYESWDGRDLNKEFNPNLIIDTND